MEQKDTEIKGAFSTLQIPRPTKEQIEFLAKTLGKSQTQFLKELIYQMYVLGVSYKTANVSYDSRITTGELTVTFSGNSRLIHGHFKRNGSMTDAEASAKIENEIENAFSKPEELKS